MEIEACGANRRNLVSREGYLGRRHGFLDALAIAYKAHLPLALSPDDVWLCIALGFAQHVNLHAEALGGFVGVTCHEDGSVGPAIGWAVTERSATEKTLSGPR